MRGRRRFFTVIVTIGVVAAPWTAHASDVTNTGANTFEHCNDLGLLVSVDGVELREPPPMASCETDASATIEGALWTRASRTSALDGTLPSVPAVTGAQVGAMRYGRFDASSSRSTITVLLHIVSADAAATPNPVLSVPRAFSEFVLIVWPVGCVQIECVSSKFLPIVDSLEGPATRSGDDLQVALTLSTVVGQSYGLNTELFSQAELQGGWGTASVDVSLTLTSVNLS